MSHTPRPWTVPECLLLILRSNSATAAEDLLAWLPFGIVDQIQNAQLGKLGSPFADTKQNFVSVAEEAHAKVAGPTLCSMNRGLAPDKYDLVPQRIPWQVRQ